MLADINVGLLYLLAVSSLGVYGVIIAGWASNSKYPFYSAPCAAAAQMVSYEVSIGFVLIPVVLWAGTFNLSGIVVAQQGHIVGIINGFGFNPLLFPLAVIFLISAMAETARAPFDLTEAESELVAGYQTEYSSMSFALFWLGEYGNVLLMCAHERRALLGRLAAADRLGAALRRAGHLLVLPEDLLLLLHLLLGEGDRAALPLRPADAARLEDIPAHLADLGVPGLGLSDAAEAGDAAMVSALVFLAATSMAQAAPAADAVPACSLVTPGGHAISFFIGGDDAPGMIQLSATSGSTWPAATLRAAPARTASGLRMVLGADRRGLALELGSAAAGQAQRSATLFLRENQRSTLPVAYGFCEDRTVNETATPPAANAGMAGADNPAFDPGGWTAEDCALILSNGRRLRFDFTQTSATVARLDSRELWSGRPVTTQVRSLQRSEQVSAFGEAGGTGPEGIQMMIVAPPRGAKLIRFRQLGDPALANVTGYGICGYSRVERRAAQ